MFRNLLSAVGALCLVAIAPAQGPDPIGLIHPAAQPLSAVPVLSVPQIDRTALDLEDEQRAQNGAPARYAVPFQVAASPRAHGLWEELDETFSVWRLRVHAPDSSHVNLGFGALRLPPRARLMLHAADHSHVLRPFDAADHTPTGDFWSPVVMTEQIVIEVYVPTEQRANVVADLVHVGAGYRFFGAGPRAIGLDGSGSCQIDVACPQGAAWVAEIPAVAALSSGGSIFCTGFMVNNTAQDARNYFMTAHHCGVTAGVASSLVVYWNYENTTCNGTGGAFSQFNLGASLRSTWSTSDFTLLELFQPPNPAWGISYLGWSRSSSNATSATGIHHPSGDAKKISFEFQPTQVTSYGGFSSPGNGSHLRLVDWDLGTTEPGSSGSPLFDQNRRVIGQLHGGTSDCSLAFGSDWYGRFAVSWLGGGSSGSRLSNWLDPLGTGAVTVDTYRPVIASATASGTGCYSTRASFMQAFTVNTFDLAGTTATPNTIELVPTISGFRIQPGTAAWFDPTSPALPLGNEQLVTLNLPWPYAFPGGTTSTVRMSSNGFVWLDAVSTQAQNLPNFVLLAQGPARLAPLWLDLDPSLGGSCHFDVDPSGDAVYFTWAGVPAAAGGAGNWCQLVLRNSGSAEYRYREVPNQPSSCLVGWSRGNTLFPSNTDISAAMPFEVGLDLNPLTFTAVGRPLLGTTQTLNVGNLPSLPALAGAALLGFADIPGGIDLAFIGAPGCPLFVQDPTVLPLPVIGTTAPCQVAIPSSVSLSGTQVFTQGALLVNGVNALGLMTSNMVTLVLGGI